MVIRSNPSPNGMEFAAVYEPLTINAPLGNLSGIYSIIHLESGRLYIGQSQCIGKRWKRHISMLDRGSHTNAPLQMAWAKYGPDAFAFHVIETCDRESLNEREQFWLDRTQCYVKGMGFNVSRCAEAPTRGLTFGAETRAKIGAAHKGKVLTAEHRAAISAAKSGVKFGPHTEAHKKKIGDAVRGNRISDKQKGQLKAAALARWNDPAWADAERARVSALFSVEHSAQRKREQSARIKAAWADPVKRASMLANRRYGK